MTPMTPFVFFFSFPFSLLCKYIHYIKLRISCTFLSSQLFICKLWDLGTHMCLAIAKTNGDSHRHSDIKYIIMYCIIISVERSNRSCLFCTKPHNTPILTILFSKSDKEKVKRKIESNFPCLLDCDLLSNLRGSITRLPSRIHTNENGETIYISIFDAPTSIDKFLIF